MNVIGHRKIFYIASGAMVLAGFVAVILFRFKPGIDFAGGTLWEIRAAVPAEEAVAEIFRAAGIENVGITPSGNEWILRFRDVDEKTHQELAAALKEKLSGFEELRFDTVGPTIGRTLRQKAVQAIVGVLLVIALYIAWAFRQVSRPVSSWKYGLVTVVTLFHDVMAPIGLFAVLGRALGVEIDSQFIVALLVVMGFSVHDTIVVFDRIRENLHKAVKGEDFGITVNRSVNETLVRSLNTSLTVLIVLAALFVWGPASLKLFVLALAAGIGVGTYSSIFLASPLLVDWAGRARH